MKEVTKYTIVRDTREKELKGWWFTPSERCAGTQEEKLDVGDYSIKGLEKFFTIERKGSVAEFCGNLNQARFVGEYVPDKPLNKQSEFVRLEAITHPFIILEFDVDELIRYPYIEGIPARVRRYIRFKGPAAFKKVIELQMKYKTTIIFAGKNRGKDVASSIFKRIIEEVEAKRKNG
jgi:hypothetical protein